VKLNIELSMASLIAKIARGRDSYDCPCHWQKDNSLNISSNVRSTNDEEVALPSFPAPVIVNEDTTHCEVASSDQDIELSRVKSARQRLEVFKSIEDRDSADTIFEIGSGGKK
jgi:hypothetical protein